MYRQLRRLHWLTVPSRRRPHGSLGAALLLLGFAIMGCAMCGNLAIVSSLPGVMLFVALAVGNGLAGVAMVDRAPAHTRPAFLHAAYFQCCLAYYVWRFSPACAAIWTTAFGPWPWLLDCCASLAIVGGIVSFAMTGLRQVPAVAAAILVGSAALGLLAVYPLQLAYGGEEWWTCIQRKYPMQAGGMVGYIYVPATTAFAAMLFGATLWLRKILSDIGFGGGFLMAILATLGGTVLMQEVHIPIVSTQKIYLPCPAHAPGTLGARVEASLDFSALAQSLLRHVNLHTDAV